MSMQGAIDPSTAAVPDGAMHVGPVLSAAQQEILDSVLAAVRADHRFLGLLAGGSFANGGFDAHSDLDFILVVEGAVYPELMAARAKFAAGLGNLLAAFTGEHVGEQRLLVCLFGPDPLHVDLKFVTMSDLDHLVERPVTLFARTPELDRRVAHADIAWPNHAPEWFEARFWVWTDYTARRLARGELFDAIGALAFIRDEVLGPLLHHVAGRSQRGMRRIEALSPAAVAPLAKTLAGHDVAAVTAALIATVDLYLQLRDPRIANHAAEVSVRGWIDTHLAAGR